MLDYSEHLKKGDDVWVPTVCAGCYNCCGILVHRVNGKVAEIKGDPKALNSHGHICAKGASRALDLYHPDRVTKPLKRTNPKKGVGEDPGWVEISWEEAMTTITKELKKIKDDDPRKLILSHFDIPGYKLSIAFAQAFGTVNFHWNRACYCGSASHPAWLITNGTLNSEVDFKRSNYTVCWGTQLGHMINTIAMNAGDELAEARREGRKFVVVDPYCSHAAAKADEWIPIKPGTDGALALAMLHHILNDLGIYDIEFLKEHTNGTYLIKPDGKYLRDKATNKPLVCDLADGKVKVFDSESVQNPAIEGEYKVSDRLYKPAFQVLKDHLENIDIAAMSEICTVPEETIKRFAKEFAEAAQVGATIEVNGHTLPFRPAGIDYKRGMASHKGGLNSCWSIHLLNLVLGACDVPGSQRGVNPIGPYWEPGISEDGLIVPADIIAKYNKPYPGNKAKVPECLDLHELFPASLFTRGLFPMGIDDPKKYGIDYEPEAMIHGRSNLMMNSHEATAMAETLKKLKFQLSINNFIDETTEFADIVLPDAHDLERWDMFPANDPYAFVVPGQGSWYWLARQAVVEPPGEARPWTAIYLEIAERLGLLEDLYKIGNGMWMLNKELDPKKKHTVREIAPMQAKKILGEDFDIPSLNETSCTVSREKTMEEAFPKAFLKSKAPIYLEYLLGHKEDVQNILDELKLDWDLSSYSPVPNWIPCEACDHDKDYELIATNCKLPTHQFSITSENMWIDEISVNNPYAYNVMMHTDAAKKRGIKTGDTVRVESRYGNYTGKVKVTELIHPECVNTCGTFGHWSKGMPVSEKKGVSHNDLLPPPTMSRVDTLSGQIDMCVRVRVSKA
ncbi:MAG: molybdopterin-dependent oxidoreductase [Proteobacteria bacterium]|nr:molybdopterin-dependent oxidoreductase [Pseudomonadota bacterium]